jgi:hypothetical protein
MDQAACSIIVRAMISPIERGSRSSRVAIRPVVLAEHQLDDVGLAAALKARPPAVSSGYSAIVLSALPAQLYASA